MVESESKQKTIDYERGYLDRKHNMGYCGNTPEYEAGYYEIGPEIDYMAESRTYKDAHENHGWYT